MATNMLPRHERMIREGRKTHEARPVADPLPMGELVALGGLEVVLEEPAKMLQSEFIRKEWYDRHGYTQAEREQLWPDAAAFLVYPIAEWREKAHEGVMVGLFLAPEDAEAVALEGGEPPEELHLTLAYLGGAGNLEGRESIERIVQALAEETPPVEGVTSGTGVFTGGEQDVMWLHFDSADLPAFRQELVERLEGSGFDLGSDHGFTPHITLMYADDITSVPNVADGRELRFTELTLAWGGDRISYALTGKKEAIMPYDIDERDGEFCVIKTSDGSVEKCHASKEDAEAHLTALRINVEKTEAEKVFFQKVEEDGEPDPDEVLLKQEETDLPSDEKTRGEGQGVGGEGQGDGGADVCVCPECGAEYPHEKGVPCSETECPECSVATAGKEGRRMKKPMAQRLRDAWQTIKDVMKWADYEDQEEPTVTDMLFEAGKSFMTFKGADGEPWLLTWTTNAFIDRDREIFSTNGLEQYVEIAEKMGQRGTWDLWHVDGTEFAEVQGQAVIGRHLVEIGPFLDTPVGRACKEFFVKWPDGHPTHAPEGWGCSPQFRYLPEERKGGVFETFFIEKRAVLPRLSAANVRTRGGTIMKLTEKQRDFFKEAMGEENFVKLVEVAEEDSLKHEQAGVAHKDHEPEPEPEKTKEIDIEMLAGALAKHFDVRLDPLEQGLQEQASRIEELQKQLARYETGEAARKEAELPRIVLTLQKRASEAEETILSENDELKKSKPKETVPGDKSGAASFFGPK